MDASELRRRVALGPLCITTHDGLEFDVFDKSDILIADNGCSILVSDEAGVQRHCYLSMSKIFTVTPIYDEDEAIGIFEAEKHAMHREK